MLDPIRLSSVTEIKTDGREREREAKEREKKTWNSMTTPVHRDRSDRQQYKQENIRLFAASQNT